MPKSNLHISFIDINDHKSFADDIYSLPSDTVLIYTIYLPEYLSLINDLYSVLNHEECERAARYYKDKDRTQFIISRSILKFVLSAYTKTDVNDVQLDYDLNNKPFLSSHPWLNFNVSHSEDFALIAISQSKVGIDVEYLAKDFDFLPLLPDVLTESEILDVHNAINKANTFYTFWTRKEAFVKALGKGIDDDFKKIPCQNGAHTIDSSALETAQNWQIFSFDLYENYIGAVAFENSSSISKNITIRTLTKTFEDLVSITILKNK